MTEIIRGGRLGVDANVLAIVLGHYLIIDL